MDRGAWQATDHGATKESDTTEQQERWTNAICGNMDGPGDGHAECSQTEIEICCTILLICGI